MTKIILPIALALTLATGPALAARLATPPIHGGTFYRCSVAYLGTMKTPTNVLVTGKLADGTSQQWRASLTPKSPSQWIQYQCRSDPPGQVGGRLETCEPVYCVFSFSVPASDIRASVCVKQANGTETCLPAS